ncbi:hypothetical protein BOTBODRAFT_62508 [Botryobasidium botryosum FD-172 SS1]|uniref:Transcription factor domain-containing protein n=1 Tax=Botryobasidium botryosum (strain FD-172 SS1) TaxID=930990 RepID=A0A067N7R9_BOTB1|nr:hypothetical protein BOTBODRAFT_62508 [Botryobasidium botryosum FD-172 SS1]
MRKFWSAYKLPSSDPEGLHPALIDVLCLLGCLHGPTSLQPYEVIFYKRLNRSLHDSLANKDRLLDFIRASGLAAVYCFARSRVIEGQNRLAAITQFAVACGLHKIDTHDFNAPNLNLFLLGRPRDLTALGDMIHAWWSLFCIDQLGAMVLEIPATLRCDDESVTTIWPCSFEEYEGSGNAAFAPYSGFSSLRSLTPGPDAAIGAYRNVYALRTKSCIMFYRGMRLASAFREGTDVNHDAYVAITVASCLAEDIALYRRQKCPSFDRPSSPAKSDNLVHDSSLIFTISMSYGALIQLFHVFAGDFRSHRKRFDVARKCARFAAKICRVTPSSVNLATWLPWYSAYEVLAWHPIPFEMLGDGAAVAAARTDLDALTDAFKRFGRHYSLDFKNDRAFQRLGALDTQCLSQISQAQ